MLGVSCRFFKGGKEEMFSFKGMDSASDETRGVCMLVGLGFLDATRYEGACIGESLRGTSSWIGGIDLRGAFSEKIGSCSKSGTDTRA